MQSESIFQVQHDYADISDQHVATSLLRMAWGTAFGTLAGLVVQAIAPATSKVVVEIIGINLTRPRVAYLMLVILAMLGLVMIIRLLNRGQLSRASIVYVAVMFGIAFLAHITVQITTSIVLVVSLPIVAAGVLLVFIMALGYYVTPALVGGADDQMLAYFIAFYTTSSANWGLAAALGVLLLTATAILYLIYARLVGIGQVKLG